MLNNLLNVAAKLSPADLIPKSQKAINRKITLEPTVSTQLLTLNENRHYLEIVLLSDANVTLHFGEGNATAGQGLVMIGRGSTYAITQFNLFTGRIAAISTVAANISFVEWSF